MNYLSLNDVKTKPIDDKIRQAEWSDSDLTRAIEEAESYIESFLVRLGYTRDQLKTCLLVKKIMMLYCWYIIMRDIYTLQSPNVGSGEDFKKWKEEVEKILQKIEEQKIVLVDEEGKTIKPFNPVYDIRTTTKDVKRAVDLGPDWGWSIDTSYYDSDITNK